MNPIIPTVFSADPAAHVWPNDDRIWVYASNDIPHTNTCDTMNSYHVFSSEDMINWIDYGPVLHLKDVSWAISHMWAIDAVLWENNYYLVYCAIQKNTGEFKTGLAISPVPQGPFKDIGFIEGVEDGQDPSLFVENGIPYLFWGAGRKCRACQLTNDLMSAIPETIVDLTPQLLDFFEAPFVHKYNGKYYLTYPGFKGEEFKEEMYYATSNSPLGPYVSHGKYIPAFEGNSTTNHGSVVEWKGNWYAFHHSQWVSNNSTVRSLMCDKLTYDENGFINPITPSKDGPIPGKTNVTIRIGAEHASLATGALLNTHLSTEREGYTGYAYATGFNPPETTTGFNDSNDGILVMFQSGIDAKAKLYIRYATDSTENNKVQVNGKLLSNPGEQYIYNNTITFPEAPNWNILYCGEIDVITGENFIKIYAGTGNIDIDYIDIEYLI